MKKKRIVTLTTSLILITGLFGCSRVKQLANNARKNIAIDKTLPVYDLNKENFKEISYDGKTYEIMESAFKLDEIDKPIGKISQRVTIDENNKILDKKELRKIYVIPDGSDQKRIDLNFGWVYSVKDIDSDKTIAVVVNEKYRKASILEH